MNPTLKAQADDHLIAWLTALALVVHVLEYMLPIPLPGVKPGLANVVSLIALVWFGWRIALWISLLRVILGSIITGSFLTPTFFLSFSGAVASLAAVAIVYSLCKLRLSLLGLCIISALAHISAQFWLAYFLFIPHKALLNLYPIFLTGGLLTGMFSGMIALKLMRKLNTNLAL